MRRIACSSFRYASAAAVLMGLLGCVDSTGEGGGHVDQAVQRQTLADYLVWLWRGYPIQ